MEKDAAGKEVLHQDYEGGLGWEKECAEQGFQINRQLTSEGLPRVVVWHPLNIENR